MTEGILIYAHNNEQFDYFSHAVYAADRVKLHISRPVTIVTDVKSINNRKTSHNIITVEPEHWGKRNMAPQGETKIATWKNANRYSAYDLSPYDSTIIIDSDYLVNSGFLSGLFNSVYYQDFLCHRNVFDATNRNSFAGDATFGQFRLPMYWATVIFFRKTEFAKEIFQKMALVKEHYKFFSDLYKFNNTLFRNDYALSIALMMQYDHIPRNIPTIPLTMTTAPTDTKVSYEEESDTFNFEYMQHINGKGIPKRLSLSGMDIHCLNKFSLEEIINET